MQRFLKVLRLREDPGLIERYIRAHDEIWPEIRQGIKDAGVADMELYLLGNLAVMTVEIADGLVLDEVMAEVARRPRQAEWEDFVQQFQQCAPGSTSAEKWQQMNRIFKL